APAELAAGVLRQPVAGASDQHRRPVVLRCDVPFRARGAVEGQPATILLPADRHDPPGTRLRVRPAVRVHPGVRSRPEPDRKHLRQRLLHHDRLPRRPRARWTDPLDPHPVSRGAWTVRFAQPRRPRGGDAVLALRRHRVGFPLRHPVHRGRPQPSSISSGSMNKTLVVGLAAVAGVLGACGGGGGSGQPAGSTSVTMTEFKFDPSTIEVAHGNVTFWLVNSGTTSHDMAIRDSTGKTLATSELVTAG